MQFTFNSLNEDEQHFINNIKVTVCFGHEGEIDEFLEDLIDDNSGESWNDFERAVTSLRTINYLVNTFYSVIRVVIFIFLLTISIYILK